MGEDKEVALPIDSFSGINRNIERERISPLNLYAAKNLWENTLNVLETRWNSEAFATFPTNVTKCISNHKIYKSSGDHVRLTAVQCTPDLDDSFALPTGFAVSLVTDADGYWSNNQVLDGVTFDGTPTSIRIRFVGFGVDKWTDAITYTGISGYSASTDQKLRISITAAQDSNITGYEIYSTCDCGISGSARDMYMWAGYGSLVGVTTATHDYYNVPLGQTAALEGDEIGEVKRIITASGYDTGGSLLCGKTYYVAIAPLNQKFSVNSGTRRCAYAIRDITRGSEPAIIPVTIPGTGSEGMISIDSIDIFTASGVVLIGETPDIMIPVRVVNEPTELEQVEITDFPSGSPAVMQPYYELFTAAEDAIYFKYSSYSVYDMFAKVSDDGLTVTPIFHAAMCVPLPITDVIATRISQINLSGFSPKMGDGDKVQYQQFQDILFHVNGFNPDVGDVGATIEPHSTGSNYSVTDGNVSMPVFLRVHAGQSQLPNFKFISSFEGSIILSGGPMSQDLLTDAPLNAARQLYFSQALEPFDFVIPTTTTHQTVAVQDDEEIITGIGIYSNSTGDSGPFVQLLITKKNKVYVLNSLPTADGGALDPNVRVTVLSAKIGCVGHNGILNTPMGTIIVSKDDVYVIRGDGEPTPIGREISPILKGADLTNVFACYHDRHLKLSFYHEDYDDDVLGATVNNVEFWLDINKLIEQKGVGSWVGPMIGHRNQFCFVEDRDGDGLVDNESRDRVCCDGYTTRLYLADVKPADTDTYNTDFNIPIESEFVTKDFDIGQQDNNWNKLIKRTYWKLRLCHEELTSADLEEDTYIDGELFETKEFTAYGLDDIEFYDQPLKVTRLFPTGRPRGRTCRKVLRTSARVGIAGFQLNYSLEKRRI